MMWIYVERSSLKCGGQNIGESEGRSGMRSHRGTRQKEKKEII